MKKAAAILGLALLGAGSGNDDGVLGMKHPALSPDGARIAFSWHGDIWVGPAGGGRAERLTHHPAHEQKPAWSPDGKRLAFTRNMLGNLDLFVVDGASKDVRRLTYHSSDDDAAAWSPNGEWIAFQSTRDSNLDLCLNSRVWDVWRMPASGGTATRVTRFRGQNPAWSPDGKRIAYDRYATGYADGEHNIFLIAADGSGLPRAVASGREDSRRPTFRGDTLYFSHEANGIHRSGARNVWKTTVQGGGLIQVTGHRGDHVTWPTTAEESPLLVYEYDFDLHSVDLRDARPTPKKIGFTAELPYRDEPRTRTFTSGFSAPAWSPSGSRIAFACRGDLWTASPEGGDARRLTEGESHDRDPSWSADEKRIVYCSGPWAMPGNVTLLDVKGKTSRRISREEGLYRSPNLSPDGTKIVVSREQDGETDLWIMDVETGAARAIVAEKNVEETSGRFSPDAKRIAFLSAHSGRADLVLLPLDRSGSIVLKTAESRKSGLAWSLDGRKLAYATQRRSRTWTLTVFDLKSGQEKEVVRGGRAPSWSPDASMLAAEVQPRRTRRRGVDRRTLSIFDVGSPQKLPLEIRVRRPVTRREEMRSLFLQVWGSYVNHYYDPFFHGRDMAALRARYLGPAGECRTKDELYALINDMIGELRSSHVRLWPAPRPNQVVTGSLAADLERNADGTLVVRRIEAGGPAAEAEIKEGEVIVAVGSKDLGAGVDFDKLMTRSAGEGIPEVRLAVRDAEGDVRTVFLKGLDRSALRELKYRNRTAWRKKLVNEKSGGRLGYHHIKMMTQAEVARLRAALEKEFPKAEGLVLDERDGVGGMAHRPVCELLDSTAAERLNRKPACWMRNRNGWTGPDRYSSRRKKPARSWDRPVIMIQNAISRSDKEILPYTFRHLGIGYTVGEATAGGVIGGSMWTMQDGSRIVVSVQGWFTAEGRNMEGWGVPPDFRVTEKHEDLYAGRDAQLEKSIEVLLAQMDGKISAPRKPGAAPKAAESSGK